MSKINLNESYLHSVVMSSINNLIKEDVEPRMDNVIDYTEDILSGKIDYREDDIEWKNLTYDMMFSIYDTNSKNDYDIICDVNIDQTSPYIPAQIGGTIETDKEAVPAEYDVEVEVRVVLRYDEELDDYEDITSNVDIQWLNQEIVDWVDWDGYYMNKYE